MVSCTKFLAGILLVFSLTSAFATDHRPGAWLGTFAQKKLGSYFSLWAETQLRYNLESGKNEQILYRPGILQKLNERHQLGYLFAYIQSDNVKEHRFALQHVQQYGNFLNAKFSSRSRLEARFIEDDSDDAARFRYLLRMDKNTFIAWNEVFLNLTNDDWTGNRTFDRNRLFLGFKKEYADWRIEYGYLNQFVPRKKDVMEHIATVYFFI